MSMTLTTQPREAATNQRQDRVAAFLARSEAADGQFWYSVVTTSIYCRPSCPSRHAKLEHVRFHDSLAEARRTGFRPCGRCRPEGPSLKEQQIALVARACALIRERMGRISTAELSEMLGVSRGHFHKIFRRVTGQAPGVLKRQLLAMPSEPWRDTRAVGSVQGSRSSGS